jgi:hypothetical protein
MPLCHECAALGVGAAVRVRFLQPGLAVILIGLAVKLVIGDTLAVPLWVSPAFIGVVLAAVASLSIISAGRRRRSHLASPRRPMSGRHRSAPRPTTAGLRIRGNVNTWPTRPGPELSPKSRFWLRIVYAHHGFPSDKPGSDCDAT